MRSTQSLISTLKETPSDAEVISHQLLLRAGMIRKVASGLYNWLPMGLRVLRNVEKIVREEMNAAGSQEVLMPVVQPAELWQESGRWEQYGAELCRIRDRHQREFCLGPTHEEVITDLVRNEINSYKQLPLNLYQIQTKFRDEIRPRFGLMRGREFTMKDAYSFHLNQESLQTTYDRMHQAYSRVFDRIGLDFRPVVADTGSIGGSASHEFHVLAESGEDDIAFSDSSDYAANVEMAEAIAPKTARPAASDDMTEVATPGVHSIDEVSSALSIDASQCLKTLLVEGELDSEADDNTPVPVIALVVRGDHELNDVKAEKLAGVKSPLTFASEEAVIAAAGCKPGSIGPVGLNIRIIADHSALNAANFACGANKDGYHLTGVNWERDLALAEAADIRNAVAGDPSPCGQGTLQIKRGIEVGHIFQLGTKYSEALGAKVLNENGKEQVVTMGCYGIGVSRVVAAAIEQNHDDNGIIWPASIAPIQVAIVPINYGKSDAVREKCDAIYEALSAQGIDCLLFDEPKARLGGILADVELIGIPHRIVVGDRGLDKGEIEYRQRRASDNEAIAADTVIETLIERVKG